MSSQKISQFNVSTSLSTSDLFTFIVNGTNKSIAFSDFKTSLGVTGTLSQDGDPLGTPILDCSGTNYGIRNLESSRGVIASVSAQNGVSIGANFTQPNTGATIIEDLNAKAYNVKAILGGANISVTSDSDHITVGFIPTGGSSQTIPISTVEDFPSVVGGKIPLGDYDYLILNDLTVDTPFLSSASTTFRAASAQAIKVTYTGTGAMFTGVNSSTRIERVTLAAPLGSLFDFSNTVPSGIFQFVEGNVESCDTIGTFNNMFLTRISALGWEDIKTNGMLFTGTNINFDLGASIVFLNGGTFVDLGSALFNNFSVSNQIFQATSDPTATFLSGLAGSGNIISGGLAVLSGNRVSVLTTPLDTITISDNGYEFFENSGISDTIADGLIHVEGSTTETVITTTGVKVKVVDVWVDGISARFDYDVSGRLTYTGDKAIKLPIDLTSTLFMASGGDKQCESGIAINGVPVSTTFKQGTVNSTKAASITTIWQHNFVNGDYIEHWVSNESDTTNIVVKQSILRIN